MFFLFLVLCAIAQSFPTTSPKRDLQAAGKPRILCLHGGFDSGPMFERELVLDDSMSDEFEFYFPTSPTRGAWELDLDQNVRYLNDYVQENGPFHGIMGYSMGSAFAMYYLSVVPQATFQMAMLFCGTVPEDPAALASVAAQSPFNGIPALIYMGKTDFVISNRDTIAQAAFFTSPVVIRDESGGHMVPEESDPSFADVVAFMRAPGPGSDLPVIEPEYKHADYSDFDEEEDEDEAVVCLQEKTKLKCPKGEFFQLASAFFGRSDVADTTCAANYKAYPDRTCAANEQPLASDLQEKCNGARTCKLKNRKKQRKAYGLHESCNPFLQVQYNCVRNVGPVQKKKQVKKARKQAKRTGDWDAFFNMLSPAAA